MTMSIRGGNDNTHHKRVHHLYHYRNHLTAADDGYYYCHDANETKLDNDDDEGTFLASNCTPGGCTSTTATGEGGCFSYADYCPNTPTEQQQEQQTVNCNWDLELIEFILDSFICLFPPQEQHPQQRCQRSRTCCPCVACEDYEGCFGNEVRDEDSQPNSVKHLDMSAAAADEDICGGDGPKVPDTETAATATGVMVLKEEDRQDPNEFFGGSHPGSSSIYQNHDHPHNHHPHTIPAGSQLHLQRPQ